MSHLQKDLQGVLTALVTPFFEGKIDYTSLEKLVEYQLKEGIQGLVLLGTTGENSTLTDAERKQLLEFLIKQINHRIPVWIGTGSNCTQKAVQMTQEAADLGANGALIVTPYYNRPTQNGLYLHYEAIAQATSLPICLYSIPTRCGVEIEVDTVCKLRRKYKHIVGIKEAGGSCNRVSQLLKDNDNEFKILGGDDALALPFFALGAQGLISVASNWIVKPLVKMYQAAAQNDLEEASNINRKFYPLFRALTVETNPVPIKQFLYQAGIIRSPEVRLPLCPLSDKSLTVVNKVFESLHGDC